MEFEHHNLDRFIQGTPLIPTAYPLFFSHVFRIGPSGRKEFRTMTNQVGFEYLENQGESVFETFLRYTDEKEKSSAVLAGILRSLINRDGISLLDVGSGNGEYLKLALNQTRSRKKIRVTLLEPSGDLVRQLRLTATYFPDFVAAEIVNSTFDDFTARSCFDIILASHLPFPRGVLPCAFRKMLDLLAPDGCLIVILREKDDVHEFRTTFKSKLMGEAYRSLTIDDAVQVFNEVTQTRPLRILRRHADSELRFLLADNLRDTISIIEFFLNKKWEEFPDDIRDAVLSHVNRKNGVFHQTDGFAVVWQVNPSN